MTKSFLKKALVFAGAALLALPLALNANVVNAADENATQDVIITKYGFKSAEEEQASGEVGLDKDNTTHSDAAKLAGAEFTVYDVTDAYWKYVNDPANKIGSLEIGDIKDQTVLSEAINQVASQLRDGVTAQGAQTTDENGQATFTALKQYSSGKPAVYVFSETKTPEGFTADKDFVVSLPYGNGTDAVKIFPKNIFDEEKGKLSLKFKKVDATATSTALEGAIFKIVRTAADGSKLYAKVDNAADLTTLQNVQWVQEADATEFTSNNEGLFGFTSYTESKQGNDTFGLTADATKATYAVKEVKAPAGYLKDAKIKDADAEKATESATNDAKETTITDTPEGILPHTGGAGIVLFVALGAALIVLGGVAYNKRRASF
ncbi:pilin N-terminal domain-containing protein [Lacticaseibacillus daqingensis]|uniref:pilin N-terminal domain-containing protein n=1 Tax=Lacticaseibacillus daqingensis TaxID=2486014 RepID=UPI0013DE3EDD|nr:pilin N-terminal domain-containing protein [Lacticaseibacillus daqingensis]